MKLVVELKNFEDESLNSWLIRNSIANGSDPKSFYIALLGKYSAWNKDIDKYLPAKQAQQLSNLISLNQQQIHNLTLEPYIQKIMNREKLNRHAIWYFVIPTGQRGLSRVSGMHFCPECLKETNPYLKKQWKLAWNVGCAIHKTKLLNKCPRCSSTFAPQLLNYDNPHIYLCTSCGFDLRDSQIENVDAVALKFQETLNNILFNSEPISFPALQTTSINDLFMTIRIFIPFFQYAHKIKKYTLFFKTLDLDISYMKNTNIEHIFEKMNIDNREFFLKLLYRFLQSDLDTIKQLLEKTGATQKTLHTKLHPLSSTILYLSKHLKDSKNYTAVNLGQSGVKPKDKDEVNRLYNELLQYI